MGNIYKLNMKKKSLGSYLLANVTYPLGKRNSNKVL